MKRGVRCRRRTRYNGQTRQAPAELLGEGGGGAKEQTSAHRKGQNIPAASGQRRPVPREPFVTRESTRAHTPHTHTRVYVHMARAQKSQQLSSPTPPFFWGVRVNSAAHFLGPWCSIRAPPQVRRLQQRQMDEVESTGACRGLVPLWAEYQAEMAALSQVRDEGQARGRTAHRRRALVREHAAHEPTV